LQLHDLIKLLNKGNGINMATIDDVARKAGVSVATVSRVLNRSGNVKGATVERVQNAIEALAYVPNLSARNLRRNESMTAMIMAPNFTNPYYSHILAGIGDMAQILGYSVFICNTADTKAVKDLIDSSVKTNRADGVILLSSAYDASWLTDYVQQIPIVQCCEYVDAVQLPRVAINNYQAAFEAVEYLLNLGHRRIAILSADNSHISTKARYEGYCDALRAEGLDIRREYHVKASPDYSYGSGYVMANKLFNLQERPSAVFCVSDILALSVIAAAGDRGLSVPGDVSVMGFDDVDYTTMFHPHLTTVRQPCYEMGRTSMQALHDYKTNFPNQPRIEPMPHLLTVRESTAPCKIVL